MLYANRYQLYGSLAFPRKVLIHRHLQPDLHNRSGFLAKCNVIELFHITNSNLISQYASIKENGHRMLLYGQLIPIFDI